MEQPTQILLVAKRTEDDKWEAALMVSGAFEKTFTDESLDAIVERSVRGVWQHASMPVGTRFQIGITVAVPA
jgi:hypothetical protein